MSNRSFSPSLLLLLVAGLAGCGDDSASTTDGGDDGEPPGDVEDVQDTVDTAVPSAWFEPDPEGRTTEGNLIDAEPEMVVVTSTGLAEAWAPYAAWRTLAGTLTRIVTMDEVFASATGVDEAETLRNWLHDRWSAGALRFALLGGDADLVPFRRVESHITVPLGGTYSANGPAELYFAELDSTWDADGDGIFGERDQDLPLEATRGTEIAVGRVPAGRSEEVANYLAKVATYERDPFARATYPLLLSDIATDIPVLGEIDGAESLEITFNDVFPDAFKANVRKLYATASAATRYGGEVLRATHVAGALNEGYPVVFHNGHGSHWNLAAALDGDWARGLTNEMPTVFASCACLSGNFADIADEPTFDGWTEQGPDDDSAAEYLIINPYGAVGYLGNTGVGLGPIGGAQFLQAFYQAMFQQGIRRLGEAFNWGRAHLNEVHLTIMLVPFTVTADAEYWTQMILILLGDPALPMWTAAPRTLELVGVPATYGPGYQELTLQVVEPGGAAVPDATVVLRKEADLVLRGTTDADGQVVFRFVPFGPAPIVVRATGPDLLPAESTILPAI